MNRVLFFSMLFLLACNTRKRVHFLVDNAGRRYTFAQLHTLVDKDSLKINGYSGVRFGKPTEIGDTLLQTFEFYYRPQAHAFDKYLNQPLPAFSLARLDGSLFHSTDLKGKVVHINFWSPGCLPCVAEISALNRLAEKYRDSVVFIGVARESQKQIESFLKRRPFHYVQLVGDKSYFDTLGFSAVPDNFFIDRDGVIRYVTHGGPSTSEKIIEEYYQDYSFKLDTLLNSTRSAQQGLLR
jgi:thiol-disulfide isomerase/thioredoxin